MLLIWKSQQGDANTVATAFQGAKLLTTDLLPTLIESYTQSYIVRVLEAFVSQQVDLNISLTAIGCLWSSSDIFAEGSERPSHGKCLTNSNSAILLRNKQTNKKLNTSACV